MRKAAEDHAEEDKKRKDEIELINDAEALCYSTEKTFKDLEGKVPEKETKAIKDKVAALKKLLEHEKKDTVAIKTAVDELNEIAQKAGAELYKQAQEAQAKQGGEGKAKDDTVVDADVVDEKTKKKGK